MRKPALSYPPFIILGILSVAASNGNTINCGYDDSLIPGNPLSKGTYQDDKESQPCYDGGSTRKSSETVGGDVQNLKPAGVKKLFTGGPALQRDERSADASGYLSFNRPNPIADGYKRGPGFRSWGGKRATSDPSGSVHPEKITRFASWGGKRSRPSSGPDDVILAAILNRYLAARMRESEGTALEPYRSRDCLSGGTCDDAWTRESENYISGDEDYEGGDDGYDGWTTGRIHERAEKRQIPKRPQFQSWGGKRGLQTWRNPPDSPYRYYYHYVPAPLRYDLDKPDKRKFSSWGGKRNGRGSNKAVMDKPAVRNFNSWGGKRSSVPLGTTSTNNNNNKSGKTLPDYGDNNFDNYDNLDNMSPGMTPTPEGDASQTTPERRRKRDTLTKTDPGDRHVPGTQAQTPEYKR